MSIHEIKVGGLYFWITTQTDIISRHLVCLVVFVFKPVFRYQLSDEKRFIENKTKITVVLQVLSHFHNNI